MSVTIALIPAALAVAGLISGGGIVGAAALGSDAGAGRDHPPRAAVRTRMKDLGLLDVALGDIGAERVVIDVDVVTAIVDGLELRMARDDDGIWQAHFTSEGLGAAELREGGVGIIARLDAAYAGRVQEAVAGRIRDRADAAGFELTSETRVDDTVTMVLTVRNNT